MQSLIANKSLSPDQIKRLKELYPDELFDQMYQEKRKTESEDVPDWLIKYEAIKEKLKQKESEIDHLLVQLGWEPNLIGSYRFLHKLNIFKL